jgi:hypothetical protein
MRFVIALTLFRCTPTRALDRPGTTFRIFQFPPDRIPRVDGDADDWKMVPDDYVIGMDQLVDDTHKDRTADPKDPDVKVKVGSVKGLNRLYFLYEAFDNYWDFSKPGLHNDIFEVVVDGDLSGGPLIERQPAKELTERDAHSSMHGVHVQQFRAEFFNVFNRTAFPAISGNNPVTTASRDGLGRYIVGFGFYTTATAKKHAAQWYYGNGQLVARFEW